MAKFINIPYAGKILVSDQRTADNTQRTIDLIKREPLAFSKKLLTGHITGSAFVLNRKRDKLLLTHHAKLNLWIQLGGHCDGIKDPLFTAHREAYEESGLRRIDVISPMIFDIDIHDIPQIGDQDAHLHYDVRYLFEADEHENLEVSDESHSLKWVGLNELATYNPEDSLLVVKEKLGPFIERVS